MLAGVLEHLVVEIDDIGAAYGEHRDVHLPTERQALELVGQGLGLEDVRLVVDLHRGMVSLAERPQRDDGENGDESQTHRDVEGEGQNRPYASHANDERLPSIPFRCLGIRVLL